MDKTPPLRHFPMKPGRVTYETIHRRLWQTKGLARSFDCNKCGKPAHEWAYDGTDPDELHSVSRHGYPQTYSLDLERYNPMCRKCHRHGDNKRYRRKLGKPPKKPPWPFSIR